LDLVFGLYLELSNRQQRELREVMR
jgi:hypothetical protein